MKRGSRQRSVRSKGAAEVHDEDEGQGGDRHRYSNGNFYGARDKSKPEGLIPRDVGAGGFSIDDGTNGLGNMTSTIPGLEASVPYVSLPTSCFWRTWCPGSISPPSRCSKSSGRLRSQRRSRFVEYVTISFSCERAACAVSAAARLPGQQPEPLSVAST